MAIFDGIEILVAVSEAGNFSRAGQRLGLSKSRLSEAVRNLEAELGVRLFDRTTRKVVPTPAGLQFLQRAKRAVMEAETARAEALAWQAEPRGRLRISVPEYFAARYVVPCVAGFLDQYPNLSIEVIEDVRYTDLLEERLDLAIRITREPGPNLIVRRLGTSRVIVCCSSGYVARHGLLQHPDELRQHRCAGFASQDWASTWRFQRGSENLTVPIEPALICNGTYTLREAVMTGAGVTVLPDWVVQDELAAGQIIRLLPDWLPVESGIYAVYPGNRLIAPRVRLFVDHFANHLRGHGLFMR